MQIDTPYQYPILPGSEEWAAFTSRQERLAACYVEESILERMTTEALIETIITYPMLIDIYAYPTLGEGIAQISENFAGISILMERDDATSILSNNLQTYSQSANIQDVYIKSINQIINSNPGASTLNYTIVTSIKTPNDTTVDAITDVPWSYHGISYDDAVLVQQAYLSTYPDSVVVSGISKDYNCHSYAWYSQNHLTNDIWVRSPSAYMTDGSYSSHTTIAVGDKVYWNNGSHSGIVSGLGGGTTNSVYVTSKWGPYGLFRHRISDCPYTGSVSFWS